MPKQNADLNKASRIHRVDWIVLPGLTLLLVLLLGMAAFNQIMPKGPDRTAGNSMRMGRYLRLEQWRADVLTVAAAFRYFADPDLAAPTDTNVPPTSGIAVVRSNSSPTLPNI